MNGFRFLLLPLVFFLIGCATISGKSRLEKFTGIAKSFEIALRRSDFSTAAKFIDPSAPHHEVEPSDLKNIRIVDYEVKNIKVAEDKLEVLQDTELKYYHLDHNILNTIQYRQEWRYKTEDKVWLLQTGLPELTQ